MVQEVSGQAVGRRGAQAEPTPLSAIRKRGQKVSNLWIFESPKNERRLTVSGDVPFMHLVLLEGDTAVAGYDLVDDPFSISSSGDNGYVRVRLRDGGRYWLLIGRGTRTKPGRAEKAVIPEELEEQAAAAGVQVYRRTEVELIGQEILFDNWLTLCAIMTRARSCPSYLETQLLLAALDRHDSLRVCDVLGLGKADPAVVLAVVAKALQNGIVQTDLSRRLFGMHSQLKRVRS
ncbi:hypothetical protein LQ564_10470 [Massilia sp. G4R7]|uniref:Uncharacterized protein n=1 Tax=Massilia phyllostachyos TaxID=2898585 RepID=A0ABS8Q4Q6_9BURK|nr:hypothetical protein [Massilia phyllostachyos]MCD2516731.1 hypothetical protein [Massilia phyllostachyos]